MVGTEVLSYDGVVVVEVFRRANLIIDAKKTFGMSKSLLACKEVVTERLKFCCACAEREAARGARRGAAARDDDESLRGAHHRAAQRHRRAQEEDRPQPHQRHQVSSSPMTDQVRDDRIRDFPDKELCQGRFLKRVVLKKL